MDKNRVVTGLYFNGMSPQRAIKYLRGIIDKQKAEDKRFLRIESYQEYYNHPFAEGTEQLRLVIDKSFLEKENG